jgi:hypothetical protein
MFRRRDRNYVDEPTGEREVVTRDRRPVRASDEPVVDRSVEGGVVGEGRVERPYADEVAPTYREERVERRYAEPAPAAMYDSDVTESHGFFFDSMAARVNSVLFAVLLALETLLALRFLMKLFGANTSSGFVSRVYDWAHPFTRPFNNAFNNRTWDQGIVEVNTLLAMGIYLLVFALIAALVNATLPHHDTLDTTMSRQRRRITHA